MVYFEESYILKKTKPKKRLGQHFLHDQTVIDRILATITEYSPMDMPIIEVGPGTGILTRSLYETYSEFRAIEYDRDMVEHLDFLGEDQLILGDFLRTDLSALGYKECHVVGNFPYNISSQIIFKILDEPISVPVVIGMFQKEMAERICAGPGTKANGVITIKTQAYYEATKLFDIPPTAFNPPPKVNSSVILLKRNERTSLPCDPALFKAVVNTAFSQRRKKIRNTLKVFTKELDMDIFQKRPEHLSVEEFINITLFIEQNRIE